jgi:hypothetical protein
MSKKTIILLSVTGVFVVVAALFEFMHRTADLEPVKVEAAVLEPFDPSLDSSFVGELEERVKNTTGLDLVY